jgi:hypothetical protein
MDCLEVFGIGLDGIRRYNFPLDHVLPDVSSPLYMEQKLLCNAL